MQLLLHARRRLPRKRFLHSLASQQLVLLKLVRRHEKIRPHRVKATRAAVCGQIRHIDVHAEQLPQRVLVFTAVQPPHGDHAILIPQSTPRRDHHVCQIIKKISLRSIRRLLLVLRRHVAGVHLIENLLPLLRRFDVLDLKRKVVHAKLPFLLFRSMA